MHKDCFRASLSAGYCSLLPPSFSTLFSADHIQELFLINAAFYRLALLIQIGLKHL